MRVLLDTHTFLWAISDDARLGAVSRSLIFDQAERVLLSHISLWEIAIKHALARTDMPVSAAEASSWADASGFELLPLALEHVLTLEQLPLHHRDPFDPAEC
jgi:PIN domain nuclease of toxin-antitoxin system